ncbi:MAG: hypothetical protein COB16_11475 [Rhodobacteraceae bacterium]|nr:MAG: hypothetical protein COB16_11475 [Paracoccaceae bacterium]
MSAYAVTDQTDESQATVITADHFGVNLVTIYDEEFGQPNSDLAQLAADMGITTLRFPGGAATEHFFDMTTPDATVSIFDARETLLPMNRFLAQAGAQGMAASIVIPTKRGFGDSAAEALLDGSYGQRDMVDAAYLSEVLGFVTHTVEAATANGVELTAFELGNEFWGSGEMTAQEYGRLMAVLAPAIQQHLAELGLSRVEIVVQSVSSASRLFSPRDDVTAYVDPSGAPNGGGAVYTEADIATYFDGVVPAGWVQVTVPGQGPAYAQLHSLADAINAIPGAADAIGGIADHHYLSGGFEAADSGYRFGFSQFQRFANLLERSPGLDDPTFHITEWNANSRNALNNRGLQHASMIIENFYEMTTHGIETAQIWPLSFDNSQSITLVTLNQQHLTIAGEMFSLMRDSLIDLEPVFDWSQPQNIDVHGFGNDTRLVLFASERSGEDRQDIELDLSAFLGAQRYFVTATQLGDDDGNGQDHRATPVLSYSNGTTLQGSTAGFDLEAWAMMRLEFTRVGAGNDQVQGRGGKDQIHGFGGNDILHGGGGRDRIYGGAGNDHLFGNSGRDHLNGSGGQDIIHGGGGRDRIQGGNGNDVLDGGRGRDRIHGGNGDDVLLSGGGNDVMSGGRGRDTFVFAAGGFRGVVLDFNPTEDRIDLSDWGVTGFEDLEFASHAAPGAHGLMRGIISHDSGRIRLDGFDHEMLSELSEDHFIFG